MFRTYKIILERKWEEWLNRLVAWRIARISERQFLYALSIVVGLLSGLAAFLLKSLIHFVAEKLTGLIDVGFTNYLFLVYPLVGIFLTVLFVRYIVKDDIGHGVSKILYSISRQSSRIKPHNTWTSMVASSLTIGLGGSVGAEAPIVLTGASIGSNLASLFKLNYKYVTLMVGCGAAGAIAGIFNAPIAGIVFTLEVLMLDLTMASLIPLLISAVTATMFSYFSLGEGVLLRFMQIHHFSLDTVWFYILLGIFTGLVGIWFTRMTMFLELKFKNIKKWGLRLLIGGLVMGFMVFIFPPLWGEGYREIGLIFSGKGADLLNNSLFVNWKGNEYLVLIFLAGILIFKVIAMVATTGSGGVGGIFAPTLFMGAIAGYFFALLTTMVSGIELPGDNFALAGMAGMMAAVMHAPLTGIFLTAEMTGGYNLFIPLMITSTVAYVTIMRFEPYSVYTKRLAMAGDLLTHHKDKVALHMMKVRKLIETDFEVLRPDATLRDLVKAISVSHRNLYPVVDENETLLGMVKLADVRSLIFEQELYDKVFVRDLMYMPEYFISPDDSMEKVVEKFETSGRYNLAVIEDGKYLGFISRAVAFSKYRKTVQDFSHD
ncbi:chloride channel protein, CIC family [Mariniphaga anaerophila]|uniref:Chloride channel protein, CIC family n=1 Tax=Mariniphaga anaerophila TaxID=1484053 RepID=A0A1M4W8A5_9BACT|nr:chloride channel protein [Mariniphaga anaerophila]SHE77494.1 chloride channel protein, CIC family [Mariniphaga anaerophila]